MKYFKNALVKTKTMQLPEHQQRCWLYGAAGCTCLPLLGQRLHLTVKLLTG